MMKKSAHILLSFGALAGLIFTLTLNTLANALPLFGRSTGTISDNLPNLFVPAGLTFSVWGVIYLAVTVFSIYQVLIVLRSPASPPQWWGRVIPWVIVTHFANGTWILVWHALWYRTSVLVMLVLFFALIRVVRNLGWSRRRFTGAEFWFAVVPFSLYLGWISVALPANITAVLVSLGITDLAPGALFWAASLSTVAAMLGFLAALVYRDAAYAIVIAWALLGIAIRRGPDVPFLAGWAAALAVVTAAAALVAIVLRRIRPTDSLV